MKDGPAHWIAIAAAAGTSWVLISLFDLSTPALPGAVYIGIILGTVFGQVTVCGAWTALGTAHLGWRLLATLVAALGIAMALATDPFLDRASSMILIGGAAILQWILVQVPLLGLRRVASVRIATDQRCDAEIPGTKRLPPQFGIRQLMFLTASVAVVLAGGRLLLERVDWQHLRSILPSGVAHEAPIFAYIVVVNLVLTLPLIVATLLRSRAILSCGLALAFAAVATYFEIDTAFRFLVNAPAPRISAIFWSMNASQALWVLGLFLVLRSGGYRLTRQQGQLAKSPSAVERLTTA